MSAATKASLDEAVAAHLADEIAAPMVTGYILMIAGQNLSDLGAPGEDDSHRYVFATAEAQPTYATVGLARMLALHWDAWGTLSDHNES